eukprot:1159613-Pelagomonas_calceolata.AAC.10
MSFILSPIPAAGTQARPFLMPLVVLDGASAQALKHVYPSCSAHAPGVALQDHSLGPDGVIGRQHIPVFGQGLWLPKPGEHPLCQQQVLWLFKSKEGPGWWERYMHTHRGLSLIRSMHTHSGLYILNKRRAQPLEGGGSPVEEKDYFHLKVSLLGQQMSMVHQYQSAFLSGVSEIYRWG